MEVYANDGSAACGICNVLQCIALVLGLEWMSYEILVLPDYKTFKVTYITYTLHN